MVWWVWMSIGGVIAVVVLLALFMFVAFHPELWWPHS